MIVKIWQLSHWPIMNSFVAIGINQFLNHVRDSLLEKNRPDFLRIHEDLFFSVLIKKINLIHQ